MGGTWAVRFSRNPLVLLGCPVSQAWYVEGAWWGIDSFILRVAFRFFVLGFVPPPGCQEAALSCHLIWWGLWFLCRLLLRYYLPSLDLFLEFVPGLHALLLGLGGLEVLG